jgi:alpha-tubulin suppressor-like RCC1 family protein
MAGTSGHALRRDGELSAWGPRDGGVVGDGTVPARWGDSVAVADRPVPVSVLRGVQVARLGVHAAGMAISTEGRVFQWPVPRGPAKAGDVWQPLVAAAAEVPLPDAAVDVAATGEARLALLKDGTVWAWGYNTQGLWGNGERADTSDPARWRAAPQPVPGVRQAVALATGTAGRHALVLLRDGTLRGWGNSDWGQIGAGVAGDSQLKAVTPKIGGVARVWAGGNNSFALTRDGRFWAWGASQEGTGLLGAQSKVPVVWPMSLLQPA